MELIINPQEDGITHVNCYSKSKTELGRLLSNFAHTPFIYKDKWRFSSVESAWYSYIIQQSLKNVIDDSEFKSDLVSLSKTHGYEAKMMGRSLVDKYHAHNNKAPSVKIITELYRAKIDFNEYIMDLLVKNELPLVHYYVKNGKYVDASKYQWMCDIWNAFRNDFIKEEEKIILLS